MKREYRQAIGLDFDGVLHSYTSGWSGVGVIADGPVPGAIGWLIGICLYSPYDVNITSVRCNDQEGIDAMKQWLEDHIANHMSASAKYSRMGHPEGDEALADDLATVLATIRFETEKNPQTFIFIDDRGFKFNGTFPSLTELEYFKPWYK